MNRRFVIGFSPTTRDVEIKISSAIEESGGKWWHWIPNMWLVNFDKETPPTAEEIFAVIKTFNKDARILVMEIVDKDWQVTNVKNAKGARMADWLVKYWDE